MAKIVIAGSSDCPYYAKVELLADLVEINVPNFHVHKIVKTRKEWASWIHEISKANNWSIKESPVIWRELVDRGGKGHLIGGPNEFQEYIRCYYNIKSDLTSSYVQEVAIDNVKFKEEEDVENSEFKAMSSPVRICICGAANYAVPHFVLSLGSGQILGESTELSLIFLDQTELLPVLKGLQMATFDLGYPLIRSISITDDPVAAFAESTIVVIFESVFTIDEGHDDGNDEDLTELIEYYQMLGGVIEKYSPQDVRVLLVPNGPHSSINIMMAVLHRMLYRIPRFSVVGMATWIQRQAAAVLSKRLNVNPSNICDIIIWGNFGGKKFVDISRARIRKFDGAVVGPDPFTVPVTSAIWDKKWLQNDMEKEVVERFEKVLEFRRASLDGSQNCYMALAQSVCQLLKLWLLGDSKGHIHSLLVASDGTFGIPEGVVFSLPVHMSTSGYWSVVQDFELSEEQFRRITECVQDVISSIESHIPSFTFTHQDSDIDENFIDSQIRSMLEEIITREEANNTWMMLRNSLNLDEKMEVSKNIELLQRTVDDMKKTMSMEAPLSAKEVDQLTKMKTSDDYDDEL